MSGPNDSARHKERFLSAYRKCGNITVAAQSAGMARRVHYNWYGEDHDYAKQFDDAQKESTDLLVAEARRRAVVGTRKYLYHNGKALIVKGEHVFDSNYSDNLLMFLIKANDPALYRDNYNDPGKSVIIPDVVYVRQKPKRRKNVSRNGNGKRSPGKTNGRT